MARLLSVLLLAGTALAFESNIAYRSPSLNIDGPLAVNVEGVKARLGKRQNQYYTGNIKFEYGVASGDPYQDSAVLWTHVNPSKSNPSGYPLCVRYVVSTSPTDFSNASLAWDGNAQTTWDVYNIVKVIPQNLKPWTQYYYRFDHCDGPSKGNSTVGAFKTLPAANQTIDQLRLAVYSCSNLPFGYFHAYGRSANDTELDYVQHVGDYLYENRNGDYGNGTAIGRAPEPDREISSLQDYRDRYAQYRKDPQLQALHAHVAWQTVWDDHEVADNTWSSGSADSNNTLAGQVAGYEFSERKANAVRAYYEWLPIRQVQTDDTLRIWRNFSIGTMADMIMLDTRQYNRDITDVYYNTKQVAAIANDANRTMTGANQESWFFQQLDASQGRNATWKLVMQQVIFAPLNQTAATRGSFPINYDQWNGYGAERQAVIDHIAQNNISNTIILAGDSHASWAFEINRNGTIPKLGETVSGYNAQTGEGSIAVEFAGSAVSSPSSYGQTLNASQYRDVAAVYTSDPTNPGLQFAEGQMRGYFKLILTPSNARAEYYGWTQAQLQLPPTNGTLLTTLNVAAGANRFTRPLNGGQPVQFGSLRSSNSSSASPSASAVAQNPVAASGSSSATAQSSSVAQSSASSSRATSSASA